MCDMARLYVTHSFVGSDFFICTIQIMYKTNYMQYELYTTRNFLIEFS